MIQKITLKEQIEMVGNMMKIRGENWEEIQEKRMCENRDSQRFLCNS